MFKWLGFFLFFPMLIYGSTLEKSCQGIEKIYNQLLVEDYEGAFYEINNLLEVDNSWPIFSLALKIYSYLGKEEEWIQLWKSGSFKFSEEDLHSRSILEDFCWGILKKGNTHSSNLVRLFSLFSIAGSNDLKAEKYILQAMQDDDFLVQMLAIKLSEHYATPNLKKQISYFLKKKNLPLVVRLEVLDAVGRLGIFSSKPFLFDIIKDRCTSSAEKRVAIRSLVMMQSLLEDFLFLFNQSSLDTQSSLMVCELIRTYNLVEYKDLLFKMIESSCLEVQHAALSCLMTFNKDLLLNEEINSFGVKLLDEKYPLSTRFLAAKLLLLSCCEEGKMFFEQALSSSDILVNREAAGVLLSSGEYGVSLAKDFFLKMKDEEAAVDLSILLLLRKEVQDSAINIVSNFFKRNIENPKTKGLDLLFVQNNYNSEFSGDFNPFHLSTILLRLLALVNYPCDSELLPLFLEHKWKQGFSYLLSSFWEDKPNEVLSHMSLLIDSPSKLSRLEAMLSYATLVKDEESLIRVEEIYNRCSWQEKIRIFEVVSSLEHPRRISFLLKCCFEEEMLSLKIIAAGALLLALQ